MTLLLSRKVNVTLVMSGAALSVPLSWLAAGERPSRVSAACVGSPLTENVTYNDRGMPRESSLMQYKIPCRTDIGHIDVSFESSYEGTGPFGAKSIGEVVINTPLPAVADAIYHATHKRFYELPITREQIAMAVEK